MRRKAWIIAAVLLSGCTTADRTPAGSDTTGPYINLNKYVFDTTVGNEIDFSYITGYDDVDGLVPVTVLGQIDYNTPGEYYPVLSAVDYSNNETLVGIVVNVREEMHTDVTPEPEVIPHEEEAAGCDNDHALRPDLPCSVVVPETAEGYEMLYYGTDGLERCGEACEAVYRNDGTFWGYGRKKEDH